MPIDIRTKRKNKSPLCLPVNLTRFISIISLYSLFQSNVYSDDLLTVYHKAAQRDPALQQAIADYNATKQNLPIAVADLLPSLVLKASLSHDKISHFTINPAASSKYFSLELSQSLFEWDKIQRICQANYEVLKAIHDLEAAKQDLLIRVSTAYFDILEAEDNLEYVSIEKDAIKKLYDQAQEKFNVGFIAIADVEEAKARYDTNVSDEIKSKNDVANKNEVLWQIINEKIKDIAILTPKFIPTSPKPTNIDQWVDMALKRNHTLVSQRYEYQIKEKDQDIAFAGFLPSAKFNAHFLGKDSSKTIQISDVRTIKGYFDTYGWDVTGNWNLFAGGGTLAKVNQTGYYAIAEGYNTDKVARQVTSDTRQSYRNITSSVSQIKALEQAIKSGMASLEATKAGYELGTRASIDVLNSLTDLYNQKQKLSSARYTYIKNVIKLKQNSGILSNEDMAIVNDWLVSKNIKTKNIDKTDPKNQVFHEIELKEKEAVTEFNAENIKKNKSRTLDKPFKKSPEKSPEKLPEKSSSNDSIIKSAPAEQLAKTEISIAAEQQEETKKSPSKRSNNSDNSDNTTQKTEDKSNKLNQSEPKWNNIAPDKKMDIMPNNKQEKTTNIDDLSPQLPEDLQAPEENSNKTSNAAETIKELDNKLKQIIADYKNNK
jgi:outer membrane protein